MKNARKAGRQRVLAKVITPAVLKWRKKKKRGAIMKPSTFKKIVGKSKEKYGKTRATKIAGSAYWRTVQSKYKKRGE